MELHPKSRLINMFILLIFVLLLAFFMTRPNLKYSDIINAMKNVPNGKYISRITVVENYSRWYSYGLNFDIFLKRGNYESEEMRDMIEKKLSRELKDVIFDKYYKIVGRHKKADTLTIYLNIKLKGRYPDWAKRNYNAHKSAWHGMLRPHMPPYRFPRRW